MYKFKKDDLIIVNTGKDKGKSGKIIKNNPKDQTAFVEGTSYYPHGQVSKLKI